MKTAKYIALLVCFIGLITTMRGAQVDSTAASSTVKGWLQSEHSPLGAKLGNQIGNVETYKDASGSPLYHVVNLKPSGYVIVAAEDQTEPIIAFVSQGKYDSSEKNPLGALISRDLPNRVAHARKHANSAEGLRNHAKWQKLLLSSTTSTNSVQPKSVANSQITDLRVAPLIQTAWNQETVDNFIANSFSLNSQIVIRTHFDSNHTGDTDSANAVCPPDPIKLLTPPNSPASRSFFIASPPTVDVTNGPDSTVTNIISVTVPIQITVTNTYGEQIFSQSFTTNISITNIVNGGSQGATIQSQISFVISFTDIFNDSLGCYNFFAPPHSAGDPQNAPCGCVATALAQLMYYQQYPSTGVGTPSFTISFDGNPMEWPWPLRGGDGYGGPYDWGDMPLDPSISSKTLVERMAIGSLTYDAGVAVHMAYSDTSAGSSSFLSDAKTALVTTFKYANAIETESSTINVGYDLNDMINPNLDAGLPVIFGIDNTIGGHCILCDGYGYSTGTLYHHLNMGWGGVDNAWYHLPIIDLTDTTSFYNFSACIYNVFTNGTGEIISGRVTDINTNPIFGAGVTGISTKGGVFTATTDANGIYALVGVPSKSTCYITVTNAGYFPLTSNILTELSADGGTNCGNVWGANFTLAPAQGPPIFSIQPANQIVTIGSNAIFSAYAAGQLPMTYQWQYQPSGSLTWVNLTDDGTYTGSKTPVLTISQTTTNLNGEPLQCVASNASGATTSVQVTLAVNSFPFITLSTLAGLAGSGGNNDGQNTNALFNNPCGIAVDSQTNLFVADKNNHVIRMISPSGTGWSVSTIAGLAGSYGSADGTGTNARFNAPYGVTVDSGDNVFVSDTGNQTIRKLTSSGGKWIVSTIAGLAGTKGTTDGTGSRFNLPMGLAVDNSGNIFIADEGNHNIRKLTSAGTIWIASTIAGSGNYGSSDGTNNNAQFGQPYGITGDNAGNIYVADEYNHTIRKLSPSGLNWVTTTIAGSSGNSGSTDGNGSAARFKQPTGITAGTDGSLYVADNGNNTIRRITLIGTNWTVFTVAGLSGNSGSIDGYGTNIRLNGPFGIAVDLNTNIYVSDSLNNTIRGSSIPNTPVPSLVHLAKLDTTSYTVSWNAVAGRAYQLQYKTNLSQSTWINLSNITPVKWTGVISLPVGFERQRYYRVIPAP